MTSVDILLTCNDPPHPAQIATVQGILDEKSIALSGLKAQIAALESKLEDLRQNHEMLISEIGKFEAILSPIRRLPPEIVGEIFIYFAPALHIKASSCPWKLAHICRLWRVIALSLGRLWSVLGVSPRHMHDDNWSNGGHISPRHKDAEYYVAPVTIGRWEYAEEDELARQVDLPITEYMSWKEEQEIHDGCYIERILEVLEECVQRAGRHPPSLLLSAESRLELLPVFHVLMKYSARWKNLILDNPPDVLWNRFPEERGKFPQLRKIVLAYPWSNDPSHLDFRWAANLTDLTMRSVSLDPLHIPWSQLTSYCEHNCHWRNHGEMWAAYQQLTSVVVLRLDLSTRELTHPSESRFLLPNLRSAWFKLSPQQVYAIDLFEMPALHTLSILQGYVHERPRRFDRIFPHPENAPNLKHLRICSKHIILRSEESACRLLDDFPELLTLDIDIGEIISSRFITKLTPSRDGLNVLPKLEVLQLTNWSFIHQDCLWTTLAAMVQGRFRPPPDSGVRQLRTLGFRPPPEAGVHAFRTFQFFDAPGWRRGGYRDPVVFAGLEQLRRGKGWDIQLGRDSSIDLWEESGW
ncbi:hypothetical protein C8J57DRAFT_1322216 [Mycena rebaudengoi]|nr:hypothetical protein C8J57DRAFT_1322216 [Mycena rebaudengoi]